MPNINRREFVAYSGIATVAAALPESFAHAAEPPAMAPKPVNSQMQEVLDTLTSLGGLPIESLPPRLAREQPSPTDAVIALAMKQKKQMPDVGKVSHLTFPGPDGDILLRVYTPMGSGPFPMLVYFHGGGFVIANLNTYDGSCRALCNAANCIVASVAYRQAPEYPFPGAPEDAYAALQFVMKNAAQMGGDPKRVAVAGESAGGNLAAVSCLMAKAKGGMMPVHQLLVYPYVTVADDPAVAGSIEQYKDAKPLNKAMLKWFSGHYLKGGY